MRPWYRLLTDLDETEVASLLRGHPREAFDRQFRDRQVPDDVPEVAFPSPWPSEGVPLAVLLREVALAKSSSEARRLISQGAVRVAGEIARDPEQPVLPPSAPLLVQVGKRHFARLVAR